MPRILIVDDTFVLTELLQKASQAIRFESKVLTVNSYFEHMLGNWHPAAVILHVPAPHDGFNFLVGLSRKNFRERILLIGNVEQSSFGVLVASARVRGLPVSAIGKPVTAEAIQCALRQGPIH